jgi:hypothetical protein
MSHQCGPGPFQGRIEASKRASIDPLKMHAALCRLPLKMRHFLDFAAPRLRKSLLADEASLAKGAELAKKRSKDKQKGKMKQKTAAA